MNCLCMFLFRLNVTSLQWSVVTSVNSTDSSAKWIQYYNGTMYISLCRNNEFLLYAYSFINDETQLIKSLPVYQIVTVTFGFSNYLLIYEYYLNVLYCIDFSLPEINPRYIGTYELSAYQASSSGIGQYFVLFGGYTTSNTNTLSVLYITDDYKIEDLLEISNSISPSPRLSHSMTQINYKLFMFGGYEHDNYYDDLWVYDTVKLEWTFMSTTGSSPTPRAYHGAASTGDALLIWGGEGNSGLLNDFFIYNSLTSDWSEIIPSSNTLPSNKKGACMAINIPFVYIFGGETPFEGSNELWQYSFLTNLFSIVSYYDTQLAYATCQYSVDSILIFCGYIIKGNILNDLVVYNFTENDWRTLPLSITCGIQGIIIFLEGIYLGYGGRHYKLSGSYQLSIISGSETYTETEVLAPFCVGFGYIQSKLYFFSGGINTLSGDINLQLGKETFAYIDVKELSEKYNFYLMCSPGSYLLNNDCILCPPGTYAETYGNTYCTLCGPGKANPQFGSTSPKQCYPCSAGYFNEKYGAAACLACPSGYDCPVGTYSLQNITSTIVPSTIQPLNYSPPNYSNLINNFQTYFMVSMFILLLISFLFPCTTQKIEKLDLFQFNHNYDLNVPLYLSKNKLGGCFSMIFLVISLTLVMTTTLTFSLINIAELKVLQPLTVLENEVDNFYADIVVTVEFEHFGDICEANNECDSGVNITGVGFDILNGQYKCKQEADTCILTFICNHCAIGSTSYVELTLRELYGYASSINVNVSSTSSIPDSNSSVFSSISAAENSVFIGYGYTTFYFELTPSLFISLVSDFKSNVTGYHVNEASSPSAGSEAFIQNLASACNLGVIVQLSKSNSGLYTERYPIQTFLIVISAILGSVMGILGGTGFLMSFLEKNYLQYIRMKKKKKSIEKCKFDRQRFKDILQNDTFHINNIKSIDETSITNEPR